jgi:hypothetical protein
MTAHVIRLRTKATDKPNEPTSFVAMATADTHYHPKHYRGSNLAILDNSLNGLTG